MSNEQNEKRIANDPRFRFMPEFSHKVKIDKRFKGVFNDKKFKSKCPVDVRGRKIVNKSENLKRYYRLSDESEGNDSLESSESESDESDEVSSSGESNIGEEGAQFDLNELDDNVVRGDEISSRLAICNMDWDRISATDLFVMLNSFKPATAVIKSVKIYPSQFGLERMKKEAITGPCIEKSTEQFSDSEEKADGDCEVLRRYQLSRLRYYYAVVECDSKESANILYEELDSQEYESSGNRLDLRFIPDCLEFTEEPKECCTEMPDQTVYEPNLYFTTALFQTKVECTWDETPRERVALTMRSFKNEEEALKADFSAVLASSSEEDSDDYLDPIKGTESDRLTAYKALILNKEPDEEARNKEDDLTMEITWDDENEKIMSNNQTSRLSKINGKLKPSVTEVLKPPTERNDDIEITQALQKNKTVSKKQLKKHKKNKKMKTEDNFTIDVHDERFEKIYTSDLFTIDPTNPAFKNTNGMQAVLSKSVSLKSAKMT